MSQVLAKPEKTAKIPLLGHFSKLADPRQSAKVVFALPEIMLLVLAATIAGADDLVEVHEWGLEHLDFLRTCLPFRDDIPSHDTLADVINALDQDLFKTCFMDWVEELHDCQPDVIAIDGGHRRGPSTGKRRGARMTAAVTASRCIWYRPGPADKDWCSVSRRRKRSPMK